MHSRLALTWDPLAAAALRQSLQVCPSSSACGSFESDVDSYEALLPFVGVFHSFWRGTSAPSAAGGFLLSSSRDSQDSAAFRRETLRGTNIAIGGSELLGF